MVGWKIDLCQKDGIYMARNLPNNVYPSTAKSLKKVPFVVIKFFSSNKKVAQTFVPKHLPQKNERRNLHKTQQPGALLSSKGHHGFVSSTPSLKRPQFGCRSRNEDPNLSRHVEWYLKPQKKLGVQPKGSTSGGQVVNISLYRTSVYIYIWKNQPCLEKKDTSLIEPQKEDFDDFSLKKKILFGNYFIRV